MKEVIFLGLGNCGNCIANQFWDLIGSEHAVDLNGYVHEGDSELQLIDVYYREADNQKFVPRAIFVDLDSSCLDSIKALEIGRLFDPSNYIGGNSGANNVWARAHYSAGIEIMPLVIEAIRYEAERCESLQGFQICHSIGGGTGSGMSSLLLSELRDEFCDKIIQTFTVFPSTKVSDTVTEPYNAILSIPELVETANIVNTLDNDALYCICSEQLRRHPIEFNDLNKLISMSIAGMTSCFRFSGNMTSNLRKLAVQLVPFPRIHFFITSLSPLTAQPCIPYKNCSVRELITDVFHARNAFCSCKLKNGRYYTASAIFRGNFSTGEIESELSRMKHKNSDCFVEWIPNCLTPGYCPRAPQESKNSCSLVANTSAINEMFKRIRDQFSAMFKRSAFVHWYTEEGMDANELTMAEIGFLTLMEEYEQNCNFGAEIAKDNVLLEHEKCAH